jgi:hypothetical protein
MKQEYNSRKFIKSTAVSSLGLTVNGTFSSLYFRNGLFGEGSTGIAASTAGTKPVQGSKYDWINYARIFIIDGFTYPLAPVIEFDAEKLAETMVDMHANVLRIATSGYCDWLITGTEFKVAADLGSRDILDECITACKPRGIRVVPYLRTGGRIKTSSIKPEWAQRVNPDGDIASVWDLGAKATALCWNTSYRQAFYDYVKIVAGKYDIDGMYFDSWFPFYGFSGQQICYCEGCRQGFKETIGEDLPFRENPNEYTSGELRTLERYREWYVEELFEAFSQTHSHSRL